MTTLAPAEARVPTREPPAAGDPHQNWFPHHIAQGSISQREFVQRCLDLERYHTRGRPRGHPLTRSSFGTYRTLDRAFDCHWMVKPSTNMGTATGMATGMATTGPDLDPEMEVDLDIQVVRLADQHRVRRWVTLAPAGYRFYDRPETGGIRDRAILAAFAELLEPLDLPRLWRRLSAWYFDLWNWDPAGVEITDGWYRLTIEGQTVEWCPCQSLIRTEKELDEIQCRFLYRVSKAGPGSTVA